MIVINKIVIYMYFHKICMVRDFWDTLYNELYICGKYELYIVDRAAESEVLSSDSDPW